MNFNLKEEKSPLFLNQQKFSRKKKSRNNKMNLNRNNRNKLLLHLLLLLLLLHLLLPRLLLLLLKERPPSIENKWVVKPKPHLQLLLRRVLEQA